MHYSYSEMLPEDVTQQEIMMRTTLTIDDKIFLDLMRSTQAKSKTEAVRTAITEYLSMKRKEQLLSLRGSLRIDETWKDLRQLETIKAGSV